MKQSYFGLKRFKDSLKKQVLRPWVTAWPFALLKNSSGNGPLVVYYHLVSNARVPHVSYLYDYKGVNQFQSDLDFLLKWYKPIGFWDLIRWVKGETILPANSLLLTFDDGLREIYDIIFPVLQKKRVPGVVFVCSAFIDNLDMCYLHKASLLADVVTKGIPDATYKKAKLVLLEAGIESQRLADGILQVHYNNREKLDKLADILLFDWKAYLREKKPYLSSEQIRELIEAGFGIGAHSIDHPYYSGLALQEQLEQTIVSIKEIRERFGLNYGIFAFPHNDVGVSRSFLRKIKDSGIVDVTFGTGGISHLQFGIHIQRVSLERPVLDAERLLKWQYVRWLWKRLRGLKEYARDSRTAD